MLNVTVRRKQGQFFQELDSKEASFCIAAIKFTRCPLTMKSQNYCV